MMGDSSCTEWIGMRLVQEQNSRAASGGGRAGSSRVRRSLGKEVWTRLYCLLSFILAKLLTL